MTIQSVITPQSGAVIEAPLNKLRKSPRNARRTGHSPDEIEALAASIAAKGLLQPLVVEPELDGDGQATGAYLVSIGEGRRQAHLLLAKRKQIRKNHPVRCIVDVTNDAHEISLDENVTRFAMHPADQFEAFQRLAEAKGWGAEEIAARFGVTATLVRQRLKLAAVSPMLMEAYRQAQLSLEQLMAFTITHDHARQEAVWERFGWSREPYAIRRLLTEDRVSSRDKRAVFVGAEAYEAAGGLIERDLFAEDGGGYFADPALLDTLVLAKLELAAEDERRRGWKWVEALIDYPGAHGLRRVYPRERPLTEAEEGQRTALAAAHDALCDEWDAAEEVPAEVLAKLEGFIEEIDAINEACVAYDPEDVARSGVFVVLAHDGGVRFERGFVRPEDEAPVAEDDADEGVQGDEIDADAPDTPTKRSVLPDRLVADLTAHRTAALRHALGEHPQTALAALTHVLVLQSFFSGYDLGSCLEVRATSAGLAGHAEGYAESRAGQALEARHAAWAARLPDDPPAVWAVLCAWSAKDRLAILAHCAALTVNAVRGAERRPRAMGHADAVSVAVGLDMADYWTPTVDSYLGRVTKAFILDAVRQARGPAEASRIELFRKADMAAEAERLLAESRWLPDLLRSPTVAA